MLLRSWPTYKSKVGVHWKSIRQLRGASGLATVTIHGDNVRPATFFKSDVIIIDSNNLAGLCEHQRKEWRFHDYSHRSIFADHLKYLAAISDSPQERYAVFDNVKGPLQAFIAQSNATIAHWKRSATGPVQYIILVLDAALQAFSGVTQLWRGNHPIRHPCWKVAAASGYTPVEPASGWAADDAIAALCRLIADSSPGKAVLVISNDRDLLQLLDKKVSILQIPVVGGANSLDPYRIITNRGYRQQWRISPYISPLFAALTGGRPYKKLKGLGLTPEDAAKICNKVYSIARQTLGKGHLPYSDFREICLEALLAENKVSGRKLSRWKQRGLIDAVLVNRDSTSLPDNFALSARQQKPKRRISTKWLISPLASIPNPLMTVMTHEMSEAAAQASTPSGTAENLSKQNWEVPTLIWMQPFNKGRANSMRKDMERLSRILHMLHIKHISWAVSAQWSAIDIAVIPDEHSAAFGLEDNSAFLILTDCDLSEDFAQLFISPRGTTRIGTAQALRILLQRSDDFVYLSPATKLKIQSLEAEGWKVHKMHSEVLKFYYNLRFAGL